MLSPSSGIGTGGEAVYLRDIWPSRSQVQQVEQQHVVPAMFRDVYARITTGNQRWNKLQAPEGMLYPWDQKSTYIKKPPFFEGMTKVEIRNVILELITEFSLSCVDFISRYSK